MRGEVAAALANTIWFIKSVRDWQDKVEEQERNRVAAAYQDQKQLT